MASNLSRVAQLNHAPCSKITHHHPAEIFTETSVIHSLTWPDLPSLGCSLVLYLIINHYTNFDKEHPNGDRIYRIVGSSVYQSKTNYGAGVPGAFPEAFKTDFDELADGLFISSNSQAHITIHKNDGRTDVFEEEYGVMAYVSNSYFNFFKREWLAGNPEEWNDEPNIVVLSKKWQISFCR